MLKVLLQKEWLQIKRNGFLPRLVILFPIVVMCVMPWVMNRELRGVVVDVVDQDHSQLTQRLVQRLDASRYFVLGGLPASYEAALHDVEQGQADLIVELPAGLEKAVVTHQTLPPILMAANAVDGMKGSLGAQYASRMVADHLTEVASDSGASSWTMEDRWVKELYLYNRDLNYKRFMIPALTAIILILICGLLPALSIVGEKEQGTLETINVTPMTRTAFILSKLIPYALIGLLEVTVCFLLAWWVYGLTSAGSWWLIYVLSMLLILIFNGAGLIVSNYNDTMQQAVFVMWFCLVSFILLSGLFTPVRSMPHWAYLTTYVNPMHHYIDAIRTVYVRGGDFQCIRPQLAALAAFAFVLDFWAVMSYRKRSKH